MGSDKRERQKANREAVRAAEAAAEKRAKTIRTIRNVAIFAVFLAVMIVILAGCGSSTSDDKAGDATTTTEAAAGSASYGTTPCPPADGVTTPVIDIAAPFERCIDPAKTYTATFTTTDGTIVVDLDAKALPVTTNNFVALARSGYYDGTDLFRIIPSAGIIQGGSPHTQSATDPGPGYTIADEGPLATSADYKTGVLAMARTSEANSASAQFFFLGNEGSSSLGDPANQGAGTYRIFGQTTKGLDVLTKILTAGTDTNEGQTTRTVTVEKVTITES